MDISDHHMTVEVDAVRASRQAGVLFLMSGLLAVVGIPTTPEHTGVLCGIAAAGAVLVVSCWSRSRSAVVDELEPGGRVLWSSGSWWVAASGSGRRRSWSSGRER